MRFPAIQELFDNALSEYQDQPFILTADNRYSYRYIFSQVTLCREYLSRKGVKAGQRVAYIGQDPLTTIIYYLASIASGVAFFPTNYRYPIERNIEYSHQYQCDKLIKEPELPDINQYAIPAIRWDAHNLNTDDIKFLLNANHVTTIIQTSGSSGIPKGVMLTLNNHFYSAMGSYSVIPFQKSDVWLLNLPLYHIAGISILWRALLTGGSVAINRHDQAIIDNIHYYNITHLSLVLTQLVQLVDECRALPETVRHILLGGSKIPSAVINSAIDKQLPIHLSYGCTEMASQVATTEKLSAPVINNVSAPILPYRDVKINQEGKICLRGKTLMHGYIGFDNPFEKGGWFVTNDRGTLIENKLQVLGRHDNMFISGGENIQPEEIEQYIESIDGVNQCVVVPIPHQKYGERPVAYIDINSHWDATINKIKTLLKQQFPAYKHPDHYFVLDIEASAMKINRQELQAKAVAILNLK